MFGLDELKQTRYFQEVAAEAEEKGKLKGKLEAVPVLFAQGLRGEQIALALELDVEQVRQVIQDLPNWDNTSETQAQRSGKVVRN